MIDELLKKLGLSYEDLDKAEQETLNTWAESLAKNQLTVEKIRDYITSMKNSVENELARHETQGKQDIYLKARLRNYLLLEAYLSTPDKARQQIESALSGIKRA